MFDVIIIGGGPAGLTAAIYAARREMKTFVVAKEVGGQVVWASEIENYPGFKSIKNFELIRRMREQVEGLGVKIIIDEIVKLEHDGENFAVHTNKEKFEARSVILALGLSPRRLAIPGEGEFNGRGVSYCANCDGPLYRGKTVAVVGGGNSAVDAAEFLSKIAAKVYLIHRRDEFRAFESLVEEAKNRENIEVLTDSEVKEIFGEKKVEKIKVKNGRTGEEREIALDGVFVEIGRIALTDLAKDLVKRDQRGQILVDEKCRTSAEGIFAAGDTTQVEFKQITIACGQGTIAALSAYQYLQLKKGGKAEMISDRGKRQ